MKKRIVSVAVLLGFILALLCGCSEEKPLTPTDNFFVNDFANVITAEDETKIQAQGESLYSQTTAQVVVVTVEDLNGEEISQYALDLGREWGVGSKEENNGIVILLSLNDREIYISVGYGLEGALPDSKTGRIIDVYGLEHLKQDDFSTGITQISNAIVNEVYLEYGITPNGEYTPIDQIPQEEEVSSGSVLVSWIILIVFLVIFFTITKGRGFIFLGGGGFRGGGFGGSSGGFGGFRGGGGSFGGGGAGRGF